MFTPCHVSCVTCHVARVTCHTQIANRFSVRHTEDVSHPEGHKDHHAHTLDEHARFDELLNLS